MKTRRRKIWEKRISFILIIVILIIVLLQGLPKKIKLTNQEETHTYYASSSETRKIISLVYDDSASMSDQGNINWAYANYAFQIFIGLLNPKDSLYITYMSKPKVSNLLVDENTVRQDAITTARSHYRNSNTPITAVNTAYDKLNSFGETTEPTEYWLVVITDGYLQSAATGAVLSTEYINQMVKDYSNMVLDNGSKINMVYMGIGDEVAIIDEEDPDNNAIVKYAQTAQDIITRMSEIAMEIGNWQEEITGITAKFIGKNQAEVTLSSGPLEKIAALIQGSDIRISDVVKISDNINEREIIAQDLQVKYPEYPGCATDENLIGSVQFVTGEKGYLDTGTYLITFDGDIADKYNDGATVNLFFDTAIETRIYIFNDEDKYFLRPGETLSDQVLYTISSEAYIIGTELAYVDYMKEMGLSDTHAKYQLGTVNDGFVKMVDAKILDSSQYSTANTFRIESVVGIADIDDIFTVNVPIKHAPIYATRISGTKGVIKRTDLIDRSLSMKLKIYHDDVAYNRREIQNMRLNVECSAKHVDVDTLVDTDGTITITPYFGNISPIYKIFLGWLSSWIVSPGANQIVLTFHDESQKEAFVCKEAFTISKEGWPLNVWHHLEPFIAFMLIWGYTYKPKLKRGIEVYAIPLDKVGSSYKAGKERWVEVKALSIKRFLPYYTDYMEVEEGKISADKEKDGTVVVRASEGWKIVNIILREDTISKTMDVIIHTDSDRLISIDSEELTTDENIGFIMENSESEEYSLFLIRFNPISKRGRQ